MNLAKRINANTMDLAKGITKLPFDVPQFYKDGGEVDLFKQQPESQGLAQRLPQAGQNAASQSQDLRYQMNKQGKSYMPKPDPYRVNLGQNAGFTAPSNIRSAGPTLIDSNMAAGVASNAANLYQGPYKEQIMSMFPKPQYKEGGEVDPTESGGYGLIQGEGTGKSDEIDATLNQQDYILPIETVDMVGRQWLDSLVSRIMEDEQGEMENGMEGEMEDKMPLAKTPEVEARVSNQEYRIPAKVVDELGVEFFDKLKELSGVPDLSKTVDGKPAYAYDGLVEDESLKRTLKSNIDSYPADPKRFGYQGVPSTKQIKPYIERGTDLVPQSELTKAKTIEPVISRRGGVENYSQQNFKLEGGPYQEVKYNQSINEAPRLEYKPADSIFKKGTEESAFRQRNAYNQAGQQSSNLRNTSGNFDLLSKATSSNVSKPGIDPYTGNAIKEGSIFKSIGNTVNTAAKNFITDPVNLGIAAYDVNKELLNRDISNGNAFASIPRLAFDFSAVSPAKLQQLFSTQPKEQEASQKISTSGADYFNSALADKSQTFGYANEQRNPDVFSYGPPSNQSPSLNNGINRPSNPNIYGRNGENLGPNPSREQVNSLFNPQPKQNGLEQYKDYLSAQVDARNRDRINQAFYGQPGDANIDARSAFEPQALENAYNIASNANLADLTKANLAANVEREKATSPTFNARLDDAGNRFIYQESGAGAPEYNSNINYQSEPTNQDQPQQKNNAQRAIDILNDSTFNDESIRKKARDYLVSLGYRV